MDNLAASITGHYPFIHHMVIEIIFHDASSKKMRFSNFPFKVSGYLNRLLAHSSRVLSMPAAKTPGLPG